MTTTLKEHKPDESLLKAARVQNEKLAKDTKYRKEAPTFKDHKAKSSDKAVKKLNKG